MKKFLFLFLTLFSFSPTITSALVIVPTANITIIINTRAREEGLFHFDVKKNVNLVYENYQSLDLQTVNKTVSQSINLDLIGSNNYFVQEKTPDGIMVIDAKCIGAEFTYDPDASGLAVSIEENTDIVCTFTNIDKNQKTPVLLIPGVLGTNLKEDDNLLWANTKMTISSDNFMDPLAFKENLNPLYSNVYPTEVLSKISFLKLGLDYSDGLIRTFVTQGYTEGADLFTFPYDWRYGASGKDEDGNFVNLKALEGQINYIINQTDAGKATGKVDIVAHSTGGLLVKQYIMVHQNDNHIGKLVLAGVPNLGAPKAYKALLIGENFDIPGLSTEEMKKIAQNMPVVYDLAPDRQYVDKVGSFFHLHYDPSLHKSNADLGYDQTINNFVVNDLINNDAWLNSNSLHTPEFDNFDLSSAGVDAYKIMGCKVGTLTSFTENIGINNSLSFDLPKVGAGDGTVPEVSSASVQVPSNHNFYAPKVKHSNLLSGGGVRQQIVNIISGSNLSTKGVVTQESLDNNPTQCSLKKGKFLGIFSPVSIEVIDQDGNRSGVLEDDSIQNDVPGADFEIFGEHKFVYLPTDEGQIYNINLQGTGTGFFTLMEDDIKNGNVASEKSFINVPVSLDSVGQIQFDEGQSKLIWNGQVLTPGDFVPVTPFAPLSPYGAGGPVSTGIASALDHKGKILSQTKIADGTLALDTADGRTVYIIGDDGKNLGLHLKKYFWDWDIISPTCCVLI
jgi:hypothetical protein